MPVLKFIKTSYKLPDNVIVTSNLSDVFDKIKLSNSAVNLPPTYKIKSWRMSKLCPSLQRCLQTEALSMVPAGDTFFFPMPCHVSSI